MVVHNDDFARPGLIGWDRDRFVAQVLEPLLAGRPGRYQRDFASDTGAEWHDVPVGVPVIVEGVSATDDRLPVPWDVTLGRGAGGRPANPDRAARRAALR